MQELVEQEAIEQVHREDVKTPSWKVGRLNDPATSPGTDPRLDSRIAAMLRKVGAGDLPGALPVTHASPRDGLLAFAQQVEQAVDGMIATILEGADPTAPPTETLTLTGRGGNEITLYVHRPPEAPEGPLPTIVHFHGGGMVTSSAASPLYQNWRNHLASAGVIAIGVEFRNGAGSLGPHPFPAGLHDAADAVQWIADRRDDLGVGKIVLSGESGGANLALTVAILANREGWVGEIDGVYAQSPYIGGPHIWRNPTDDYLSLCENDGYLMGLQQITVMAEIYDPNGAHAADPLCWPLQADASDLRGLPVHTIEVAELDPLRDEGIAYYRKLRSAGVKAVGRVVLGIPHAGDVFFGTEAPEVLEASISGVASFARSL